MAGQAEEPVKIVRDYAFFAVGTILFKNGRFAASTRMLLRQGPKVSKIGLSS